MPKEVFKGYFKKAKLISWPVIHHKHPHDHKTVLFTFTCQGYCFLCHSDPHYAQLQEELAYIAQNLEVESWSMAVDQNYMKSLNKEAVRRQDVIYGRPWVIVYKSYKEYFL